MNGAGNPEPRPAASLTASLLARRGGARPAMRRQPIVNLHSAGNPHEDLGWNDMGEGDAADTVSPVAITELAVTQPQVEAKSEEAPASPIAKQIDIIAAQMVTPARKRSSRVGAQPASLADTGRKVAFTLRIDAERHLRLRLLSALTNRSAQRLLTEALDSIIAQNEALGLLAEQVESGQTAAAAGKGKRRI